MKGWKSRKKGFIVGILCAAVAFGLALPVLPAVNVSALEPTVSEAYQIGGYCGEAGFAVYQDKDGYLYAAGANSQGQLGRGYLGKETKTEPLEGKILNEKVTAFDTGKSGFVLAITESGKLYAWGNNANGQLAKEIKTGENSDTANCYPTPSEIALPNGSKAVAVDAGAKHSLLLTADGSVYAWGQSYYGQLGLSLQTEKKSLNVTTPTLIPQEKFENEKIVQIATADDTSYALTASGSVYAWGESDKGMLCDGKTSPQDSALPDLMPTPAKTLLTNAKKISAEGSTAMALTQDGKVYVWGNLQSGQGGSPEMAKWSSAPVEIVKTYDVAGAETQSVITDILCGGSTNFLLSADGGVYAFGAGGSGELGFNVSDAEKAGNPYVQMPKMIVPTKIVFYEPLSIEKITAQNNEVYVGKTPVDLTKPKAVKITKLLNSGGGRTFVADEAGNVWSWGNQTVGLACSGNLAAADVPVLSTLFRDQDYDVTIKEKNYLVEPLVGLSVIYGFAAIFLIYTEVKRAKQQRLALQEQEPPRA